MARLITRLFGRGRVHGVEGTLADEALQRDVRLPLRTADRFGVVPHHDPGPDWHIVRAEVVEAPALPGGPWSERWTVSSDGTTREYLIVFTPAERGTDFVIEASESATVEGPDDAPAPSHVAGR